MAVAGAYSVPSIILITSTLIRLLYPPSLRGRTVTISTLQMRKLKQRD